MKKAILCSALLIMLPSAHARTWTNAKGQTVEAEVVQVNPDKTVELRTSRGKTLTVPFSTFSEEDVLYLENLLAQPADLDPVPWEKLNELLGLPLWSDSNLWDDPCADVADRLHLNLESKTDFLENYRAYPLGHAKLFGEPVFAQALYGNGNHTDSLTLVFLNCGDVSPYLTREKIEESIEASGETVLASIETVLGEPKRDSLGKDDLREKVWRWDWNDHAILLSLQESKYVAIRIMPKTRANQGGPTNNIKDDELKARLASCVERRENGDVIVRNIPMVNQGPKGYCVPATWERYLRYMDIPVDMYLLALAADTGIGGGTFTEDMTKATENIIGSNGRKLGRCGSKPDVETVAKQIDKGLPILWTLESTPAFQMAANTNTAKRQGDTTTTWSAGQAEDTTPTGHMCLIIGYNRKTGEIAISDSWGPQFAERWVTEKQAEAASDGEMNIIKW